MSGLKTVLSGEKPVAYYPAIARAVGGIAPALFLQQVAHWGGKSNDGWAFRTQEELEEELFMSPKVQARVRSVLVGLGVLEEERRGQPGRLHYRIDFDALEELLSGPEGGGGDEEGEAEVHSGPSGESKPRRRETPNRPKGQDSYIEHENKHESNSRRGAKAPQETPPKDKESSKPTNWFTVFCERLKEVGLCPTPEDREYGSKHFKQCVQAEKANEREMRRVVARMVNWRLEGKEFSPQRALNDIRGVTSIQDYRQGLPGNKPKTQEASTPNPPTSVVEALKAHKDFKHLAYLAERWDFTSDTPPPWPVLRELGGTDEERGRYLQRIQSVARKAKRAAPSGASGKEVS